MTRFYSIFSSTVAVLTMISSMSMAFSPSSTSSISSMVPRSIISSPASVSNSASTSAFSSSLTIQDLKHNSLPSGSPFQKIHSISSSSSLKMSSTTADFSSLPIGKSPSKPSIFTSIASTFSFILLDVFFKKLFKALNITSFPSSLGGCGVIFMTLLALYSVKAELGDGVYGLLSPGSDVLAKWLPVFFVPSLVTLPLAPSLGSSAEILKVATVIIVGFFFTLFSTAYSVIGIRKIFPPPTNKSVAATTDETATTTSTPTSPPPKAFSDQTFNFLSIGTILSGIATLITTSSATISPLVKTPIQTLFMLCTTLLSFTFGARLPKKITSIIHPLIICTSLTLGVTKLLSTFQSSLFTSALMTYKVGSLCPVHLGAGDVLLYMLGPAVIALSCQMYNKKELMKENLKEVVAGITVSSIGGLVGTSYLVRLLNIVNPVLRLSCLSRNITSPLAMAISSILGGDVSLAVSMVVITGLIGANFGSNILDMANIKDPVSRGLSIGSAAHGLGTAAFKDEKDAFPFAAIGMALTASACTVLVSIPVVKKLIMKIALGI